MEKIKVSQAIVVEGKYDKIKLSSVVDGVIICTNGFGIFSDRSVTDLIKYYAERSGIIILTDSDSAGFKIRARIKGICPAGRITNLYIPEIFGKEKRKAVPSKEGKLGVEGMSAKELRRIFEKAGADCTVSNGEPITKADLYETGLNGRENSSRLRKLAAEKLRLPQNISSTAMLEVINSTFTREEFFDFMDKLGAGAD